jgi:hypothetical protein
MSSLDLEQLADRVRTASRLVARSSASVRDDALRLAADLLEDEWTSRTGPWWRCCGGLR